MPRFLRRRNQEAERGTRVASERGAKETVPIYQEDKDIQKEKLKKMAAGTKRTACATLKKQTKLRGNQRKKRKGRRKAKRKFEFEYDDNKEKRKMDKSASGETP